MNSPSANEIKLVRSLREKKFREEQGLFIVEGEKMVAEALASGLDVVNVWRSSEIGEKAMQRMSLLSTPSPALAVLRIPTEKPKTPGGLCLALDAVRDPGNLGTILRLADWFGIDAVYASPDTADAYNPKAVQSSMGAIFRIRPSYCDLVQLCRSFRSAGFSVFGTFLGGENIYSASLPREGLIVMGNEANGISGAVAAEVTCRLTIPSFSSGPGSESLNAATATAITVSEFRRRL